jgi:hypothetical protein
VPRPEAWKNSVLTPAEAAAGRQLVVVVRQGARAEAPAATGAPWTPGIGASTLPPSGRVLRRALRAPGAGYRPRAGAPY